MNSIGSWRYSTLGILLTALAFFIILQMLRIQLSPQAEALREKGELYSGTWRTLTPARGQIYDRRGNLLAGNTFCEINSTSRTLASESDKSYCFSPRCQS